MNLELKRICELLKHPDPGHRMGAAEEIGALGPDAAPAISNL